MFHSSQLYFLAKRIASRRVPGGVHTYGLYRNYTLLGVFVANPSCDCVTVKSLNGFMVFELYDHDISLRPDCGRVMESLKDRYQKGVMSK